MKKPIGPLKSMIFAKAETVMRQGTRDIWNGVS